MRVHTCSVSRVLNKPHNKAFAMYYELAMLLGAELSDKERSDARAVAEGFVSKKGGTIERSEPATQFTLAYPIKKQKSAFFALTYFSLKNPSDLKDIERDLRLNTQLLRYLVIRHDELPAAPTKGDSALKLPAKKDRTAARTSRHDRGRDKGRLRHGAHGGKSFGTRGAKGPKKITGPVTLDPSLKKKEQEGVALEDVGTKLDELLEIKESK